MRIAFILSFIANVVVDLASWVFLPERVAIHFGPHGMANGWAPRHASSLLFLGMDVVLFVSLYFSPRVTFLFHARWDNLPHKEYWLAPENRPRAVAKISFLVYQFGVAIFVFLFVLGLLTIDANLSEPVKLKEQILFPALVLFLAYSIIWCVVFFRSFRVPAQTGIAKTRAPHAP